VSPPLNNSAGQHGTHVECTSDFLWIDNLSFVEKNGASWNHSQAAQLREVIDQVIGDAIAEIFRVPFAGHIRKRQHCHGSMGVGAALNQ
jgi:hypothetical protein